MLSLDSVSQIQPCLYLMQFTLYASLRNCHFKGFDSLAFAEMILGNVILYFFTASFVAAFEIAEIYRRDGTDYSQCSVAPHTCETTAATPNPEPCLTGCELASGNDALTCLLEGTYFLICRT
jgi:hypothetical protein